MSRIAYVNGRYLPHAQAAVHIEDRGYQFADGVYEVVPVKNGVVVDEGPHLDRLDRSLAELRIQPPMGRGALKAIVREIKRRNRVRNGIIYLQVTRGVAPRDHQFPKHSESSLVVTAKQQAPKAALRETGVKVITHPDIRWKRRDIKSVSLLPNVLAKQEAVERGAYEAWLIDDDGTVTEGTAVNAWIVTREREVVTRTADTAILSGVTRRAVLGIIEREGYTFVERAFSAAEAKSAAEAFLTSTTSWVMPVVRIDDAAVGDGKPGPLTRALQEAYSAYVEAQ